jgi:cytochrome c
MIIVRPTSFASTLACLLLIACAAPQVSFAAGDVKKGADVFDSQCAECHSVRQGKNKKGPSLFASIGRSAGTVPDYVYSDAMKQSGITWTPEKVQTYLAGPKKLVPGGKMKYDSEMSAAEVVDLLAFLGSLH